MKIELIPTIFTQQQITRRIIKDVVPSPGDMVVVKYSVMEEDERSYRQGIMVKRTKVKFGILSSTQTDKYDEEHYYVIAYEPNDTKPHVMTFGAYEIKSINKFEISDKEYDKAETKYLKEKAEQKRIERERKEAERKAKLEQERIEAEERRKQEELWRIEREKEENRLNETITITVREWEDILGRLSALESEVHNHLYPESYY